MNDELIQKLIELMESISPVIWATVQRQAWVDGIMDITAALFFAVAGVGTLKLLQYARKEGQDETYSEWHIIAVISAAIAAILVLTAFAFTQEAVSIFLNPDYRAIELLLGLVK